MAKKRPTKLTLRAYEVGFGDCFLLTFHYAGNTRDRNILIDFGSTHRPHELPKNQMVRIAKDIKKVCNNNRLDAVVATHRHKDHISGFAPKKNGKGSGNIIASLNPRVVIQPWTEHPRAPLDAQSAPTQWRSSRAVTSTLDWMQDCAGAIAEEAERLGRRWGAANPETLSFLGENNVKNKAAVKNLMKMGPRSGHRYVHYGSKSGLEKILPGVTTRVLGPPNLKQTKKIRKQRTKDDAEFWHLQASAMKKFVQQEKPLFPKAEASSRKPPYARWLTARMNRMRGEQLFQIATLLDKQLNNTSVILLFEVGSKKFLFPGDAQLENWMYALRDAPEKKSNLRRLANVDLYKVGHHGSLNATPKTLWDTFDQRSKKINKPKRLRSVLSSMEGVHGSVNRGTEVPRSKLVEALEEESHLTSTVDLPERGKLCHIVEIPI